STPAAQPAATPFRPRSCPLAVRDAETTMRRVVRRPRNAGATFPADTIVKGPNEVLLLIFDFTAFPEIASSETVSSNTVTSTPAGLTHGASGTALAARPDNVAAGKGVQISISAGTVSTDYTLTCRITTGGGSVREIRVQIAVR